TDWNFLNSSQDFFQKEVTLQEENYFPVPNQNYAAFQFEDIGFGNFPPLIASFGAIDFSESVDAILNKKVAGMETGEPMLATFNYETSKNAILTGANIWKWRSQVYQENASFEKFDNFIGNLVQYLAEAGKRERLIINSESFYYGNENIEISAQYFDANYQIDPRAQLKIDILELNSGKNSSFPLLLKGNHYGIELNNLPASDYSFTVTVAGKEFSENGNFTIVDFEIEQQFTGANLAALRNIADETEGDLHFLNNPENIVKTLLSGNNFPSVQKSRKNNVSLVEWYILLGIILFSLGAEWFLRKYRGLI
ncbi:MAG TPA: VWA domain-containing protein, partial [Salinimicrobium sp.]|nr:VWA domain-containing protein [Salinimicrobium sp.]